MGITRNHPRNIPNLKNILLERYLLNNDYFWEICSYLNISIQGFKKAIIDLGIDDCPSNAQCGICRKRIWASKVKLLTNKIHFCSKGCTYLFRKFNSPKGADHHNFTKIKVKCCACKKEFERKPSHAKKYKNNCCSNECRAKFRKTLLGENNPRYRKRVGVQCYFCKKEVPKTEAYSKRIKERGLPFFCSRKCCYSFVKTEEYRKENPLTGFNLKCSNPECNEMFYVSKGSYEKSITKNFFCGAKCWGKHTSLFKTGPNHHCWKGGYGTIGDGKYRYYGESWASNRKNARKRDQNACQNCGCTKEQNQNRNMDVHHIVPWRLFIFPDKKTVNHKKANDLNNLICYCSKCHPPIERETEKIIDAMGEDTAKVLYGTQKQCN